jgi:AraC family transcriptional regulator, transcriptional activator of pobA
MGHRLPVRHFDAINELHLATGFVGRTDLPEIHVFTLEETYPSTRAVMPPYSLRFYGIALYDDADDAVLEFNAERRAFTDTVTFQGPGHVVAWVRGAAQRGFIVLFQPEFLSDVPTSLFDRFPFFLPTNINLLALTLSDKATIRAAFTNIYATFHSEHPYRVPLLQAHLHVLLYECRKVYDEVCARFAREPVTSTILARFLQLTRQHSFTRRTVEAYAELLGVTPNHLSQVVSRTLGRRARDLIDEQVLLESRKMLRYTDLSVAAIADHLGFAQPTHFTRFFRRGVGMTPLDYRREIAHKELPPDV